MGAGAKVVVFDFVFASETEGDDVFAQALEKYKDHVVIGEMFTVKKVERRDSKNLRRPMPDFCFPARTTLSGWLTSGPTRMKFNGGQIPHFQRPSSSADEKIRRYRISRQLDPHHRAGGEKICRSRQHAAV